MRGPLLGVVLAAGIAGWSAPASAEGPAPGADGFSTPKVIEGEGDKPNSDKPPGDKPGGDKPAEPAKAAAPPAEAAPDAGKPPPSGFAFGSYGRMIAATDFKGRPGRDADIVARGSRLDESNYVELELRRDDYWAKTDSTTKVVATLAFANPIFHYNGDFNVKMAIRNLFIEESDLGAKGLSVWAGSRMYRGDDIYLLDFWPLDNLNTMGAGARYQIMKSTSLAVHGGLNEPKAPFYLQEVQRPSPLNAIGSTTVAVLDRQRFIGSLKATHEIPFGKAGVKASLYGEVHSLPSGQKETDPRVFETLPGESGYVIGAQLGAWTGERAGHANLFFRYASGIAAYGELNAPSQLGLDRSTAGAHELLIAFGGNWEASIFGIMAGGYFRSFRNASPDLDRSDLDEGIVIARPHLFFGELGGVAVEASYQAQQRGVVTISNDAGQPAQTSGPLTASLVRFGLIPFISPAGRGDFSRPHFRLIYTVTLRDQAARSLYPQDDVFSLRAVEHFLGVGAEWWFNSSSYSR
ncbi:MAG: carbohydrate porin [Byssovorax sp.]